MKQMILVFLAVLMVPVFGQSNKHFTELRGMEDSLGNTHLFYRMHYEIINSTGEWYYNNLHHFKLDTGADTLLLQDYAYTIYSRDGWFAQSIVDYDFWNHDPENWIACGSNYDLDPSPRVWIRGEEIFPEGLITGEVTGLSLSRQNDSLAYASNNGYFIYSTDGGYNWQYDSNNLIEVFVVDVSPFNDQILFGTAYQGFDNVLKKSTDGGNTFYTVSDIGLWEDGNSLIFFDADSHHIYGHSSRYLEPERMLISDDFGESWQTLFADDKIHMAVNSAVSGEIFVSRNDSIFQSADYGQTFSLFWDMPDTVIGIYKKPAGDLLYAATTSKIYEISPTDTTVLKMLDPVGIGEPPASIAEGFALHQNFPNPFNPSTTIAFDLPQSAEIELTIFDIAGRKVATVAAGKFAAGPHSLNFDAANLASGVYFYQLSAENGVRLSRKMLLLQ